MKAAKVADLIFEIQAFAKELGLELGFGTNCIGKKEVLFYLI